MPLRRFGRAGRMATCRVPRSQGAQWDFILIQPIEGLARCFGAEVQAREAPFRDAIAALADFEEDWFVEGPPHETVKTAYPAAANPPLKERPGPWKTGRGQRLSADGPG